MFSWRYQTAGQRIRSEGELASWQRTEQRLFVASVSPLPPCFFLYLAHWCIDWCTGCHPVSFCTWLTGALVGALVGAVVQQCNVTTLFLDLFVSTRVLSLGPQNSGLAFHAHGDAWLTTVRLRACLSCTRRCMADNGKTACVLFTLKDADTVPCHIVTLVA